MKKLLIKTNTRLSARICSGGLLIHVHSPEIGEALQTNNFASFIFQNFDRIPDFRSYINFNELVNYFVIPKADREISDLRHLNKDFLYAVFCYIKSKYVVRNKSINLPHDIDISHRSSNWIYHRGTLNLACLLDPEIRNGKDFKYKGVYNSELINDNIIPLLRIYAASFIKMLTTKIDNEDHDV